MSIITFILICYAILDLQQHTWSQVRRQKISKIERCINVGYLEEDKSHTTFGLVLKLILYDKASVSTI